jgi:hypothetical protein
VLLVVLDELCLESGAAVRHVIQASPEAGELPAQQHVELSELTSVELACRRGELLYSAHLSGDLLG